MDIENNPIYKAIYATLIKDAQLLLDSGDIADEFKKKIREERIEIKKNILKELKKNSKEITNKLVTETLQNESNIEKIVESPKFKDNLKNTIRRCVDEMEK